MTNDEHLSMCFLAICVSSLGKCLLETFAQVLIEFIVSLLHPKSSLYDAGAGLLLDILKVFSLGLACLFKACGEAVLLPGWHLERTVRCELCALAVWQDSSSFPWLPSVP